MKQPVHIVTDSSADLPPGAAAALGVSVVPARFALAADSYSDGELPAHELYERLRAEAGPPRSFGVPEAAFRAAFDHAIEVADTVLCLVTPFDVSPSFTTASAAMLSMDEGDIKIMNPGVASAGLCSLVHALARGAQQGWTRQQVIDALDAIEPQCDTLFVPADIRWLAAAGRLPLIQDRIGEVGGGAAVVRVGTRIAGVAVRPSHADAISYLVANCQARAEAGAELIITVSHADAPDDAAAVAARIQQRWRPAEIVISALSSTIGGQLGPGAIGVGVSPVATLQPGGSHA
jgi:DegV family protein with EDD domain